MATTDTPVTGKLDLGKVNDVHGAFVGPMEAVFKAIDDSLDWSLLPAITPNKAIDDDMELTPSRSVKSTLAKRPKEEYFGPGPGEPPKQTLEDMVLDDIKDSPQSEESRRILSLLYSNVSAIDELDESNIVDMAVIPEEYKYRMSYGNLKSDCVAVEDSENKREYKDVVRGFADYYEIVNGLARRWARFDYSTHTPADETGGILKAAGIENPVDFVITEDNVPIETDLLDVKYILIKNYAFALGMDKDKVRTLANKMFSLHSNLILSNPRDPYESYYYTKNFYSAAELDGVFHCILSDLLENDSLFADGPAFEPVQIQDSWTYDFKWVYKEIQYDIEGNANNKRTVGLLQEKYGIPRLSGVIHGQAVHYVFGSPQSDGETQDIVEQTIRNPAPTMRLLKTYRLALRRHSWLQSLRRRLQDQGGSTRP